MKSQRAQRALRQLGGNLKTARLKRRFAIKDLADRAGVSERTIIRLEKGDGGVSCGTLAMACLVLGEIDRIEDFLDAASDDTGLLLDREALPKRIDGKRRRATSKPSPAAPADPGDGPPDGGGVAF